MDFSCGTAGSAFLVGVGGPAAAVMGALDADLVLAPHLAVVPIHLVYVSS